MSEPGAALPSPEALGEVTESAWKALLAADKAFQAARETGSASLYQAALLVLQRRGREFHRAVDAFAEAQDE